MNACQKIKLVVVEIISILYIILFVYAALNKVLEFQTFQVQLGQSPLLSAFAGPISYFIPALEIIISAFIMIPRLRYIGLYASFSLMVMFATYIFIMLNFSPFTPCSCGGILEDMKWEEHLIFNLVFTAFAVIALVFYERPSSLKIRTASYVVCAILSICSIVILYLLSEDTMHHRNSFIRRFPKHPTSEKKSIELKYSSYYFAGYDEKHIYLGNRTAPRLITIYDLKLNKVKEVRVDIPRIDFAYRAPRMIVKPPYFYFVDGTVPCVFVGDTITWKGLLKFNEKEYFNSFVPINDSTAVVRSISSKTKQNTLGLLSFGGHNTLRLNSKLLKKQVDGLFDTSGHLVYNSQTNQIIYSYYYKNQFVITDSHLKLLRTGMTIDTISKAQVKVAKINSQNQNVLAGQPLLVNRLVATYGNYFFVNSALMGKYEPKIMWDKASIIDVYNLKNNTYAFSFYIYNKQNVSMDEFIVIDDYIINLNGKHLTIERLKTDYYTPSDK